MLRFLEIAWNAVADTFAAFAVWLTGVLGGLQGLVLDPRQWTTLTWLAFALVVILAIPLFKRRRRGRTGGLPEMMISHGEIRVGPEESVDRVYAFPGALGATTTVTPPRVPHHLKLALSNLNPYPVQLIELAVHARGGKLPIVAEAGAVVPPNGAVDVTAELGDLAGEAGVLELYLYSNRLKGKTFRLVAPLEWEPWEQSYRVKALKSRTERVARLASQARKVGERQAFLAARRREKRKELARAALERADSLKRQVEEYRVSRMQRSHAAAEASDAAVTSAMGERWLRRQPPGSAAEAEVGSSGGARNGATRQPPKQPPPKSREDMRFPDEF